MKYFCFNQGQVGDLCLNTVPARLFRKLYPDQGSLIMNVNKKYVDIIPLFYNHPHIDGFHVWGGWDQPTEKDIKYEKENWQHSFRPRMPKHSREDWYLHYHQAEECCYQNGFSHEQVKQLNGDFSCYLEKWFDVPDFSNYIAFAPFAGFYNPNNSKKLSTGRAQDITRLLNKLGWKILQIGGNDETRLDLTDKYNTDYFGSMCNILGCRAFITTDSWGAWFASAYKFPTLGLYSNEYYSRTGRNFVHHIQPINPEAIYLDSTNVNNIPLDLIEEKIKLLCS